MPASLSIENQVDRLRIAVGCESRGDFVAIGRAMGVEISASEYSLAMNDKKVLDRRIWERLLEIVEQMQRLQDAVQVPINWSESNLVAKQLHQRTQLKQAVEYDEDVVRELLLESNSAAH